MTAVVTTCTWVTPVSTQVPVSSISPAASLLGVRQVPSVFPLWLAPFTPSNHNYQYHQPSNSHTISRSFSISRIISRYFCLFPESSVANVASLVANRHKNRPLGRFLKYLTIKNIMIKLKHKGHSSRNYTRGWIQLAQLTRFFALVFLLKESFTVIWLRQSENFIPICLLSELLTYLEQQFNEAPHPHEQSSCCGQPNSTNPKANPPFNLTQR